MDRLKPEAKAAVERMLLFDQDLREAYLLKEVFYQFMASPDSGQAKTKLLEFRAHAMVADIPEFKSLLTVCSENYPQKVYSKQAYMTYELRWQRERNYRLSF